MSKKDNSSGKIICEPNLASIMNRLEKEEKELSDKDKEIDDKLVEFETKKYDLVKKLYKIDESGDIDDLLVVKRNLNMIHKK